ncbi:MAG: hypothetical protein IJ833_11335 [Lachnospiraceae bacterium]|nr:hypothetical protein [Lachnospiraceae bacterium]
MKVGKKELSMLAAIVGIFAAIIALVMVYLPYKDETEQLQRDCDALHTRIAELQAWQEEKPKYERESAIMVEDINQLIAQFPANSLEEDAVLYAARLEARNSNTFISSVGMEDPELLYEIGPTTVPLSEEDAENNTSRTFRLYSQKITLANQFSYNGMKQFIKDIVEDNNSRTIETMAMSYDRNTGILVGNTEMRLFTLSGTDKQYEKSEMSGIKLGTNNIFGTRVSPNEVVTVDEDEEQ